MNKYDIECVLEKAVELLEPKLKEKISLVEIFDLSSKILQELQFEQNLGDEIIEFHLSRSEIEKILTDGNLQIRCSNCSGVDFVLKEDDVKTITLENGDVIMWYEGE